MKALSHAGPQSHSKTAPRHGAKKKVRILLVDDHPLVRLAVGDTLRAEPDLEVCGEAADRNGALKEMASAKPDLAIVDLSLKNSDGFELIKDLRARFPKTSVLVLSMQEETIQAERVVRAGASGYISKLEAPPKLLEAVRKVLNGEVYWSERAASEVASRIARHRGGAKAFPADPLSDRERQIFEMIGTGTSTAQISAALHIDVSTVETYRSRMKEKMHLKDSTELLQAAIRWNLLNAPR